MSRLMRANTLITSRHPKTSSTRASYRSSMETHALHMTQFVHRSVTRVATRQHVVLISHSPLRGQGPRQPLSIAPLVASQRKTREIAVSASMHERSDAFVDTAIKPALLTLQSTLNKTYSNLLPGPARFAPTFLLPLSALIAALGATYGAVAWQRLLLLLADLSTQYQLVVLAVPVVLSLSGGIFAFVLMPALDIILGNEVHEAQAVPSPLQGPELYQGVLWAYAAFHFLLLFTTCALVSTHTLSPLAFAGVILSMGCEGGLVFTASHELIHSRRASERMLGDALLASMFYMHWANAHRAHHIKVATHEDPATGRLNETLYAFLPRCIAGALHDGVTMELRRLEATGTPFWSVHNKLLWWVACPTALGTLITALFGLPGLLLYVGQAVTGILMLEVVNYIEHYGLQRKQLPNGRYERVGNKHSWNANSLFTNSVVFRLQRHTDHHMHSNKPYHLLENLPDAPQLPFSYPIMMMLALVPPIYFRVMNPLVEQVMAEDAPASSPVTREQS